MGIDFATITGMATWLAAATGGHCRYGPASSRFDSDQRVGSPEPAVASKRWEVRI